MSPRPPSLTRRRALVGGCAALAVGLAGCSRFESSVPDVSAADRGEWPHRFRDLGNTNAASDGPDSLTERWSRRLEARLDRPLVADGAVFTVATDREREAPIRVLTLDAETGEDRWAFEIDRVRRARLAAVVDGTVYVIGEHVEDADGERLYAIDDDVAWTFDAEHISSVVATESAVFVVVRHGSIVALNAEDGSTRARLHPAGVGRRWLSDLTPAGRPAILDGTVFAPFARYDPDREDSYVEERVVAFDADGIAWTHSVGEVLFLDEVTAVDGTVYALTTDRSGGSLETTTASLTAIEADSGERRWTRSVEGGLTSVVAVRGDLAVVTGRDSIGFDVTSGDERWRNDVFSGPPVVAGDRIYGRRTARSFVDTVVAADLETGERTASHTFEYQLNRAPVFADGRAFARTLEYDRGGDDGTTHVADRLHALW